MTTAAAKTFAKKQNGRIVTGTVYETVIYEAAKAKVLQSAYGDTLVYRVFSNNGICLHEGLSPAKAAEYADWFSAKHATRAN